jgi:Carboxypeptidase regulatory-like domain
MRSVPRLNRPMIVCFCLVFFIAACCSRLHAQNSRGTILGHVTDSSGGVFVDATVTARNVQTGITNTFRTNSAGDYIFVNMIPGTYELTVEAKGFKTNHVSGLTLEVDQTLRQDFVLEVGPVAETVEVSTQTQMVQTDNTTLGNVIELGSSATSCSTLATMENSPSSSGSSLSTRRTSQTSEQHGL